jgi:hypothetical protein
MRKTALKIQELDKKLLAGISSPSKPLSAADFICIQAGTRKKSLNKL